MIYSLAMSVAFMAIVDISMDIEPWRSINDGVMGGRSVGRFELEIRSIEFIGPEDASAHE